ncbi:MAG TPA: hypothetical protein EYM84_11140 [Flavobacteriales bacterium]|nr:hypothetical protein [Flavobacteriales bacterium]
MVANYIKVISLIVLICTAPPIFAQNGKMKKFMHLSSPEKCWVITHPFIASKALLISESVKKATQEEGVREELDNYVNGGKLDAFRHVFWMASLGLAFNPKKALKLGVAHEKGNKKDFSKRRKEEGVIPDQISGEMDLWNNQIGAGIAILHKDVSKEESRKLAIESIIKGKCKIIKRGSNGAFLSKDNKVIKDEEWIGEWINERCLVMSNYNN